MEAPTPGCYAGVRRFEELPLSRYTKDGLKEGKFVKLTAIQVCEGVGGGQGWEEVGGRRDVGLGGMCAEGKARQADGH